MVLVQIGPRPPSPKRPKVQSAHRVVFTVDAAAVTDDQIDESFVVLALTELEVLKEPVACAVVPFATTAELLEAPTGLSNVVPVELVFAVGVAERTVALIVPFEVQV